MQNSEDKGSLSDKFRDFGAKPSDGLWDAISGGLDAVQPVRKAPRISGKSFLWAAVGFIAASAIAMAIWFTASKGTASETASSADSISGQAADSFTTSGSSDNARNNHSSSDHPDTALAVGQQQTVGSDRKSHSLNSAGSSGRATVSKSKKEQNQPRRLRVGIASRNEKEIENENEKQNKLLQMGIVSRDQQSKRNEQRRLAGNTDSRNNTLKQHENKRRGQVGGLASRNEGQLSVPGNSASSQQADKTNEKLTDEVKAPGSKNSSSSAAVINPSADSNHLSKASGTDSLNGSASGNQQHSSEPPVIAGTKSLPPADSTKKNTNTLYDTALLADSTAAKPGKVLPDRLKPAPAKWMIGGHAGVGYGKEVYLIDFKNDQYSGISLDMLASAPTSQLLPTRLYWSADVTVSRRLSRKFWIESGLQGGMLTAKQEQGGPGYFYYPVEAKVFNLGIPLALRFDFKPKGRFQFYERIGTLHTFPFAINARYISYNETEPGTWKHRTYWTYDLSVYLNFGVEWAITEHLSWDVRAEIRFISEMVSMHRIYNNTLWYGGSTGIVWKF